MLNSEHVHTTFCKSFPPLWERFTCFVFHSEHTRGLMEDQINFMRMRRTTTVTTMPPKVVYLIKGEQGDCHETRINANRGKECHEKFNPPPPGITIARSPRPVIPCAMRLRIKPHSLGHSQQQRKSGPREKGEWLPTQSIWRLSRRAFCN